MTEAERLAEFKAFVEMIEKIEPDEVKLATNCLGIICLLMAKHKMSDAMALLWITENYKSNPFKETVH